MSSAWAGSAQRLRGYRCRPTFRSEVNVYQASAPNKAVQMSPMSAVDQTVPLSQPPDSASSMVQDEAERES